MCEIVLPEQNQILPLFAFLDKNIFFNDLNFLDRSENLYLENILLIAVFFNVFVNVMVPN